MGVNVGCGGRCKTEAVQTRDTDLQEQTASRDSWSALTHIGRIQLNKSKNVNGGWGVEGWSSWGQKGIQRGVKKGGGGRGSAAKDPYNFILLETQRRHCD